MAGLLRNCEWLKGSPCSTYCATHTTSLPVAANTGKRRAANGTRAMRSSSAANTRPHRNAVRKKGQRGVAIIPRLARYLYLINERHCPNECNAERHTGSSHTLPSTGAFYQYRHQPPDAARQEHRSCGDFITQCGSATRLKRVKRAHRRPKCISTRGI